MTLRHFRRAKGERIMKAPQITRGTVTGEFLEATYTYRARGQRVGWTIEVRSGRHVIGTFPIALGLGARMPVFAAALAMVQQIEGAVYQKARADLGVAA
jgi:hypothetical protein